jgi:hypothetical protein
MVAQDQRGDMQARWRLSEKPSTPNAAMAVHRPRRARRRACQRPERKARAQGLNHAWRELPELVGLRTVQLDRAADTAWIAVWRTR